MVLEHVMCEIIKVFKEHASSDGDDCSLSQKELCDLAKKEFPTLCKHTKQDEILKGIFGQMDADKSNTVDFKEFMIFLSCLTIALEDCTKSAKK